MRVIDGDAHFLEPLDVFERYIDPPYRARAMRVRTQPDTGAKHFLVEQQPMKIFDVEAFLGAVAGYGQKEAGRDLGSFDHYLYHAAGWQDMGKRVQFLDAEGMEKQVIYPTLGLFWEGEVEDPALADAHCRAYNTWALGNRSFRDGTGREEEFLAEARTLAHFFWKGFGAMMAA